MRSDAAGGWCRARRFCLSNGGFLPVGQRGAAAVFALGSPGSRWTRACCAIEHAGSRVIVIVCRSCPRAVRW